MCGAGSLCQPSRFRRIGLDVSLNRRDVYLPLTMAWKLRTPSLYARSFFIPQDLGAKDRICFRRSPLGEESKTRLLVAKPLDLRIREPKR